VHRAHVCFGDRAVGPVGRDQHLAELVVRGYARIDDRARLRHEFAPAALHRAERKAGLGMEQPFDQVPPPPVDRVGIRRHEIADGILVGKRKGHRARSSSVLSP
jgi:hypothetical protein